MAAARRMALLTLALALTASSCSVAQAARQATSSSMRAGAGAGPSLNERPIIGILSQPGDPAPKSMSYIAASYIKWVEAAGARVIPIFYDMTPEEVRARFQVINGLLIPGGGAVLSPGHKFYDTAALLVNLAIEANDNGDYFPVHGTCLGMETLSVIISANYTILGDFNAEDAAAPLLYTENAENSHLIKSLPADVVHDLQVGRYFGRTQCAIASLPLHVSWALCRQCSGRSGVGRERGQGVRLAI